MALSRVTLMTFTPLPENDTCGVATKLFPAIVTAADADPWSLLVGDTAVTVGAALTVNVVVATPVSGLVTVNVRAPVAAVPASDTFTVSCVALFHVVEFTVTPVPETTDVAPFTK